MDIISEGSVLKINQVEKTKLDDLGVAFRKAIDSFVSFKELIKGKPHKRIGSNLELALNLQIIAVLCKDKEIRRVMDMSNLRDLYDLEPWNYGNHCVRRALFNVISCFDCVASYEALLNLIVKCEKALVNIPTDIPLYGEAEILLKEVITSANTHFNPVVNNETIELYLNEVLKRWKNVDNVQIRLLLDNVYYSFQE